jgi:hypothetical protein
MPIRPGPGSTGESFVTASAFSAHTADTTGVHGIVNTSVIVAAAAPTGVAATDEASIEAAIASLPATGGTVNLDRGTYVGRFAIDKANVHLRGQGTGATVLQLPDNAGLAQVLTIVSDGVTVSDLTVDGNAPASDPGGDTRECDGISIYASDVTIRDCRIIDTIAHGIIVWNEATSAHNGAPNASRASGNRYRIRVMNNRLENTGTTYEPRSAIDIATSVNNQQNVVAFNTIIGGDGTSSAITMHSGSHTLIHGNLVDMPAGDYAMMVHTGATGVVLTGNIVRPKPSTQGSSYMVSLANASKVTVANNYFKSDRAEGALVKLSGTIDGLRMTDNVYNCIYTLETDTTLVYCVSDAVLTNVVGMGNRCYRQTGLVSGTATQQAAVTLFDHYDDDVLVESTRLSTEAPSLIDVNPFMGRTLTTGASWALTADSACVFGGRLDCDSTQGNAIGWDLSLRPGDWELTLLHTTNTNRGIYSVQIDGVEVDTIDGYSASVVRNVVSTATFTTTTRGVKRLSLVMNATSTGGGRVASVQRLTLRRTA